MFSAVQPRREGFPQGYFPQGYGACGKTKGTQTMTIALIFWVSMLFFLLSLVGSTFFGFAHYAPRHQLGLHLLAVPVGRLEAVRAADHRCLI